MEKLNLSTDLFAYRDCFAKLSDNEIYTIFNNKIDNPVYTITIPTYKRAELLKECLESAIHQSASKRIPYQILVVDDYPERNDETETFMCNYKNHPNISYYKKKMNEGGMDNMNRAITLANTDWVILVHDDDYLNPNYIERIDYYRRKFPNYNIYLPSKKTFRNGKFEETKSSIREKLCHFKGTWQLNPWDFIIDNHALPTGTMYNKQAFLKTGGYINEFGLAADYVFFARFSTQDKALRINEKLFVYRWGVNVSLEPKCIESMAVIGHYLSMYIMNKVLHFNKYICDNFEAARLQRSVKTAYLGEEYKNNEDFKCYLTSHYNVIVYKVLSIYSIIRKFIFG